MPSLLCTASCISFTRTKRPEASIAFPVRVYMKKRKKKGGGLVRVLPSTLTAKLGEQTLTVRHKKGCTFFFATGALLAALLVSFSILLAQYSFTKTLPRF